MKSRLNGKGRLCVLAMVIAWTWAGGKATEGAEQPIGEPQKYLLKIAAQPLGDALQEFSRQSGVQVIFFSRLTDGLRAPALEGKYTLVEALRSLLVYSKLTFRSINANTVQIEPRAHSPGENAEGAAAPPTSTSIEHRNDSARNTVKGAADPDTDDIIVTGTAEGLVATRTETPLRDIPQTISIISREQIRQQNDADLADALQNAVGITAVREDSLDERFYSRGFQITSFHVDGGAAMTSMINSVVVFMGTPDLNEYDHIEVLRGADALFGGIGNPGGTVNLLRKRPLDTEGFTFSGSAGSWGNEREEFDLTGPLGFDGALRGRLDGVVQDRNYFYETASLRRRKLFGALEFDVTPTTLLTVGGSYQSDDAVPVVSGLPFYNNGSDPHFPRSTALGFDWANDRSRMRELYVQLRHEFAPGWKVKANASAWKDSEEFGYAEFTPPLDPLTNGISQSPLASFSTGPTTVRQTAFDITFTGTFDWLGRRGEAAIGGDVTRVVSILASDIYANFGPLLADAFAYKPADYPDPRPGGIPIIDAQGSATYRQAGAFASMRIYLDDAWSVVAGARIGGDRTIVREALYSAVLPAHSNSAAELGNSSVVTPYAGLTYHIDSHYSLYASYADIYTTMGATQLPNGKLLGTAQGSDLEVGTKAAWQDGAVNGSVVLYKVDQRNVPVADTVAAQSYLSSLFCCFLPGTNRSRGIDAELSGKLAPDWLLAAGYTLNINQAAAGGELSSVTPRHLLKLWTSKGLPGRMNRWTVGGSLRAQSSEWGKYPCADGFSSACSPGSPPIFSGQKSYAMADLRASYQIHPHWQAALTVSNVFDRIYYQTLGSSLVNNWYGEPRAAMLRVDAKY